MNDTKQIKRPNDIIFWLSKNWVTRIESNVTPLNSEYAEYTYKLNDAIFPAFQFEKMIESGAIYINVKNPGSLVEISESERDNLKRYNEWIKKEKEEIELYKRLKEKYEGKI